MENQQSPIDFQFLSTALPSDTFSVIHFKGFEALNEPYSFVINMVSTTKEVNPAQMLHSPATFVIQRPQGDLPYHGILKRFELQHEYSGLYFYQAELAPKLWWLTLTQFQGVFVDQDIITTLSCVLQNAGLTQQDFEFRLINCYPNREFVCQYGETHYDFFSRWLEYYGMYFYFEQPNTGAKLVITDTKISHSPLGAEQSIKYVQPSGLEPDQSREIIFDFRMRRELTPTSVVLKDYNYRSPSMDLTSKANVTEHGAGETYFFGEHYQTPSEGQKLAKIRAEELGSHIYTASGMSFAPFLRPGHTFTMKSHPRASFNQEYLTTRIRHYGHHALYKTTGLHTSSEEKEHRYKNDFTCIPKQTQFRPSLKTPKAKIYGFMNAHIDAEGSGTYAELDSQGRYKITMSFDLENRDGGKASTAVRMAQPYGGAGFGLHFPLHKKTEVAVSCVNGNPDRPVITGAAPNPNTQSQVVNTNQTYCNMTSSSGNAMHIEDQEGTQRILFSSTPGNFMRIGALNDPPAFLDTAEEKLGDFFKNYVSKDGVTISSSKWMKITAQHKWANVLGEKFRATIGIETAFRPFLRLEVLMAWHIAFLVGPEKYENVLTETKAAPVTTYTHSGRNVVEGQITTLETNSIETTLNTVKTTGQASSATVSDSQLATTKSQTTGQQATLSANSTELAQTQQQLSGECVDTCQNRTTLNLDKQRLASQKTGLSQECIQSAAQSTKLSTKLTRCAMQRTITAATAVEMASQYMETAATHNTL